MDKSFLTFLIVTLLVVSCKSSSYQKFTFKNGYKIVELQVPQNQINLDGETYAIIKVTNIELSKLKVIGVGVSILNIDKNVMNIKIKTRSSYYQNNNKFELKISYNGSNDKISHTFYIPIKKSKEKK